MRNTDDATGAAGNSAADIDVLTMGRSGIDVYPLQIGVGLEDVRTFGKFLGGSPTNVAVGVSRLGDRSAVITGVGDDPFGVFVQREMRRLGVDDRYVVTNRDFKTPVTFCEIFPPDDFPLYFYREPSAPDLELTVENIPEDVVRRVPIFWFSLTGLSVEPSRGAHRAALNLRREGGGGRFTVADLDYRDVFWDSETAAHEQCEALWGSVDVAVGNREECRVAVGESEPDRAADALLERGVKLAVVKQGPAGTLAKTEDERAVVPVTKVTVCNGLGAGDAFGAALCHSLLHGWSLGRTISFASTAGAIVASRLECSTAMPTQREVDDLIAANPGSAPIVEERRG